MQASLRRKSLRRRKNNFWASDGCKQGGGDPALCFCSKEKTGLRPLGICVADAWFWGVPAAAFCAGALLCVRARGSLLRLRPAKNYPPPAAFTSCRSLASACGKRSLLPLLGRFPTQTACGRFLRGSPVVRVGAGQNFSAALHKKFYPPPALGEWGVSGRLDCSSDDTSTFFLFVQLQEIVGSRVGQSIKLFFSLHADSFFSTTKGFSRVAHHSEWVSFLVLAEFSRFLSERENSKLESPDRLAWDSLLSCVYNVQQSQRNVNGVCAGFTICTIAKRFTMAKATKVNLVAELRRTDRRGWGRGPPAGRPGGRRYARSRS